MRYSLIKLSAVARVLIKLVLCAALILSLAFTARGCMGENAQRLEIISRTDVAEVSNSSADDAISLPTDAPDTGGELNVSDSDYDGELDVPAYIRLERIELSDEAIHLPLDGARVSSLFGYRLNPVTGKYTFHSGYDLAAPKGSEIYAMLSGVVHTAGWDNGYGNYIILDHGGGLQTLYAHCSRLLVKSGDKVAGGQTVAIIGSTGNSTGTHLHVEFRRDGQRYDPEWILGGEYD